MRVWSEGEGITVLGVPVNHPGAPTATREAWVTAKEHLASLLAVLARIPDAQLAHHLLRSSLDGCRLMHLLRGTDTSACEDVSVRLADRRSYEESAMRSSYH